MACALQPSNNGILININLEFHGRLTMLAGEEI